MVQMGRTRKHWSHNTGENMDPLENICEVGVDRELEIHLQFSVQVLTDKTWLNLQRNPSTRNQKTGLRHFKNHLKSLLNPLKNQIPPYLKMLYQFILKTMSLTSQEVGRVHSVGQR
ncbi:hypothetical protein L2E82_34686 [Cichorium intybus]|uniref:Uncharacterized protein n=1 Tax=Cichorium intybus TaxID=13427 RepID=A0ACB9BMK1_CICIN|nr:hypothetical protein L2E82_34686 [Cichorium intybus]